MTTRVAMSLNWPKVKLGFLVREAGGATPSKANPDFWNGDVPWVSPKDMKADLISDSADHVTAHAVEATSLRMIPPGAVLMVVRGMILAHTVPIAETTVPVTVNQDMKALLPREELSPRFLRYAMKAAQPRLLALVETAGHGTCCLRSDLWRRVEIGLAPLPTQQAIADFLDRKTAAIDALIEKKERLLALLAERRAALIHRAVTKGLDPSVPMKDSGVEWIGEVPAHWDVCRLSYRYEQQLGKMLSPTAAEGPYQAPYLANKDVQWDYVDISDLGTMSFSPAERRRFGLREGDLLICEGGLVGRTAVWRGELDECFFQKAVHRLRPLHADREHPRFFYYCMVAATQRGLFEQHGNKATIGHLTGEALRAHRFPFPPWCEQQTIASNLDDVASVKFDKTASQLTEQLTRLREYRQALITAAVTGQLDVPAPGEPESPTTDLRGTPCP